MDEALLALNKEQVREKEMKDLKKNVRVLKRRRQALTDRENKIQEDINRGEFGQFSSYKLPLAVSHAENKKASTASLSEEEIETLRRTAVTKQKLQAVAICYGVTSIRDEGETVFMMDPYIAGKPYGPYSLRLRMSSQAPPVLRGNSLPPAVPVKSLLAKYCHAGGEERESNLRTFLSQTFRHLRAYLSRLQQFNHLKER